MGGDPETRDLAEDYIKEAQPALGRLQKKETANSLKEAQLKMELDNAKKNLADREKKIKTLDFGMELEEQEG